ncbi:SdpI family protein [Clostridium celatum]|uniref:SdpI family protein n=1 Tax=Clostridium celatum TaxID=36834 RepID=UPI0018998051|nr:SdpI family protein [Clostridium celatum]MDY3360517.1 SdpI family protein [Clostridium celatum]
MKTNFKKVLLIIFIFLPLIITLISLNYLPDLIPAHYGFNGEVTRWGSKYESLILPIMCVVICIISLICTNYAAKKPENKNNIKSLNACTIVLAITFNVLTISFLISDFNKITNINNAFSSKLIYMALGIGFIILGNYLPKCKRNNFIGIRTSLTLSNDDIWFKTHRFGGKVFVVFGFIFTIISLIIPVNITMPILIISLIILTIVVSVYPKKLVNKKN